MIKLTLNTYLDAHHITRYELHHKSGIGYQTIDKYYKNTVVRYDSDVLNRICNTLNCNIEDIISFEKDKEE